jgi:hypothetical protein
MVDSGPIPPTMLPGIAKAAVCFPPANMATKNDFSLADWNTLRDTQYLVGFATLLVGSSGLATIKELIALSQGIMEHQSSSEALIRDLTTSDEMEAAQASMKESFGGLQSKPSSDSVQRRAVVSG